jgi:hypothetical protein
LYAFLTSPIHNYSAHRILTLLIPGEAYK